MTGRKQGRRSGKRKRKRGGAKTNSINSLLAIGTSASRVRRGGGERGVSNWKIGQRENREGT